ncbi:MAG: hypothetical protein LM582_03015 [Desulfurococcaceae archaeon]|jgi:hypothetical protein|nr:hypothetical protein [Desulfurococcaceae archaeon]MCC6058341.1 hypothetical protein [Desulfurococcaceae archaeon]
MLILRFKVSEPVERFKLLLEFTTILPLTPTVEVHDIQSLADDMKKIVSHYGEVLYVESYEIYLEDSKLALNIG